MLESCTGCFSRCGTSCPEVYDSADDGAGAEQYVGGVVVGQGDDIEWSVYVIFWVVGGVVGIDDGLVIPRLCVVGGQGIEGEGYGMLLCDGLEDGYAEGRVCERIKDGV